MANTKLVEGTTLLGTVRDWANGKFATKTEIASVLDFKGEKTGAQLAALTYADVSNGDVYTCTSDSGSFHSGYEYAAKVSGTTLTWVELGKYMDLSGYALKSELSAHTGNGDIHVTTANKSAWNAKYDKPSDGIPKGDLAGGVQTSLGKADTAYQKPTAGIPSSDMASAVQTSLGKADTAYQKPSTGVPKSDLASAVQTSLGKADTAYQKADTGIPKGDLASAVQTSLGLADSALQASDVDSALSSSSTNPVQNKVVNTALAGKSNTGHSHTIDGVDISTITWMTAAEALTILES